MQGFFGLRRLILIPISFGLGVKQTSTQDNDFTSHFHPSLYEDVSFRRETSILSVAIGEQNFVLYVAIIY
jgi:hypothetical protein